MEMRESEDSSSSPPAPALSICTESRLSPFALGTLLPEGLGSYTTKEGACFLARPTAHVQRALASLPRDTLFHLPPWRWVLERERGSRLSR